MKKTLKNVSFSQSLSDWACTTFTGFYLHATIRLLILDVCGIKAIYSKHSATRLGLPILDVLPERNELTLYELTAHLIMKHNLSILRQAIAKHLSVLDDAGLVKSKRKGQRTT